MRNGRGGGPADGPAGGISNWEHEHTARVLARPLWWRQMVLLMTLGALVACGEVLRMLAGPPRPVLAWAILVAVAVAPTLAGVVWRLADWGTSDRALAEEREHRATLVGRVRPSTLDAVDDYLARLTLGQGRSAHLSVPVPVPGQGPVSVYPRGNRLLVMVHQDLMQDDPAFVVTYVGRVLAMARGWRLQLAMAAKWLWLGGPVVVGWAVSWPWLLVVLAVLEAALTVAAWVHELSADQYALAHHDRKDVLELIRQAGDSRRRDPHRRICPCGDCWGSRASTLVMAVTGMTPAPVPLRWKLATAGSTEYADRDHA